MKIGLASDHAGVLMKKAICQWLESRMIGYIDYGAYSTESANYAIFGHKLANAVESGDVDKGIAVCGSGNGINMTLNKHQGIRAALCWNEEITRLARAHNDANILSIAGRFISLVEAEKLVEIFLNTPFDGGRHKARIDAIPL
ncbi:MAG: RpiB/LacA/LacB family sugar-phosphate isomerase [Dysgonamonadaceae bacterium]|jgi:ribose 5-phosphate isomerase B|nr:RpiB/LacA/LacB family sugar-phosphate isomerase [Dysgonamonadaceae bacterium]